MSTLKQNSMKVTAAESEKGSKAAESESSFLGFIKKSFGRSNNHSVDQEKQSTTVNGHPLADGLIKKAEKRAGPISPGHYWYDSRAGFWGVMGGPCLGIIPPLIKEFKYAMPENCTGGNTGIFVNGRELHKKDLNLLGGRGLPTERGKSYIIEISGKVVDEETGEEVVRLGKIAPTIEKTKQGFGMELPQVAA